MLNPKLSHQSNHKSDRLTQPDVLQQEFNRLEEIILQSNRIPLSGWTIVDEDKLLNQLDLLRMNWPDAFEEAQEIIHQKREIMQQAEDYAQEILENAQKQAAQILDEMGILQRAQLEASQIKQQVEQECRVLQQKTMAELEQNRAKAFQEIENLRQLTLAECDEIQDGADDYAAEVLSRIEQQLSQMLRVVRNGRQQLSDVTPRNSINNSAKSKSSGVPRSR